MANFISVIIPTSRVEKHLGLVMQGLQAQRLQNYEVIVVDDTPDKSVFNTFRQHLSALPLQYICTERQAGDKMFRAGRTRNMGVEISQGNYLAFLDSDCVPDANWLETINHVIDSRPDDEIMITGFRRMLDETYSKGLRDIDYGLFKSAAVDSNLLPQYHSDPLFPHPWQFWTHNAICHAQTFCRIGGFDETFQTYGQEDVDLGLRLVRAGLTHLSMPHAGFVTHIWHEKLYNDYEDIHKTRMMKPDAPLVRNGGPLERMATRKWVSDA